MKQFWNFRVWLRSFKPLNVIFWSVVTYIHGKVMNEHSSKCNYLLCLTNINIYTTLGWQNQVPSSFTQHWKHFSKHILQESFERKVIRGINFWKKKTKYMTDVQEKTERKQQENIHVSRDISLKVRFPKFIFNMQKYSCVFLGRQFSLLNLSLLFLWLLHRHIR